MLQLLGEVGPLQVLHRHVRRFALRVDVDDFGHVLAGDPRRRTRFTKESLHCIGQVVHDAGQEHLERHRLE